MMNVDWTKVRAEFPILAQEVNGNPLVYFDSAASSQKPRAVIDSISRYYERDNANVHRGLHELSSRATDAYEGARAKLAKYLGAASVDEIIFTRGTTEAINLVVNTWGPQNLKEGDVILLTEIEHHSNLVPWQMLAARTGATLRFVPLAADGTLAFSLSLLDGVKLFAFTHISNAMGTINPAAEFCAAARAAGVVTVVDGAQSVGHIPVDVQAMGCDFYAFSGHKMCAPTGSGGLYGRLDLLKSIPPWHGGGEMIVSVTYERATYKQPPARFEAGTPNIAGAVGLGAAVDYIESLGRAEIFEHDAKLSAHAIELLDAIPGIQVLGPRGTRGTRGALVSFHAEWAHPHDLTTYANEQGLALRGGHHCNQPLMRKLKFPGTTRASFYFYNTHDEVERMGEILRAARKFFDA